ncbi:MAG TPA: hypothetical protein PKH79_00895 [Prolixibacteraceae bacterium]|nr:hypothetical protein [Prolixibacteraceae bacterium]
MKLKINLEKIKCIKDTFGIGKDEIYLAFFVTCTDKNNPANTKAIKALTNINYKITDGSVFEPVFESNNTRDFEFVFDTEIVNALITVSTVIYEKDGGDHYEKLKNSSFDENPQKPNVNWIQLILEIITALGNPSTIPSALFDLGKAAITFFMVDDMIDRNTKIYDKDESLINGQLEKNEIELNGCG